MTPELKSFLTDLLAVLEKHDAFLIGKNEPNVDIFLRGHYHTDLWSIGSDEIKQALQEL